MPIPLNSLDARRAAIRDAFANNMRTIRILKNIRQIDLAEMCSLSRSTIVRIESQVQRVSFEDAFMICQALGVDMEMMARPTA